MKDDYQTAKIAAEKLLDDLLGMASRALAPDHPKDVMKPDDLSALCNGKLFLERGFRDVARIVDQSNLGKLGFEGIQQIIRGAFLIGACATFTDSEKSFVLRQQDFSPAKKALRRGKRRSLRPGIRLPSDLPKNFAEGILVRPAAASPNTFWMRGIRRPSNARLHVFTAPSANGQRMESSLPQSRRRANS